MWNLKNQIHEQTKGNQLRARRVRGGARGLAHPGLGDTRSGSGNPGPGPESAAAFPREPRKSLEGLKAHLPRQPRVHPSPLPPSPANCLLAGSPAVVPTRLLIISTPCAPGPSSSPAGRGPLAARPRGAPHPAGALRPPGAPPPPAPWLPNPVPGCLPCAGSGLGTESFWEGRKEPAKGRGRKRSSRSDLSLWGGCASPRCARTRLSSRVPVDAPGTVPSGDPDRGWAAGGREGTWGLGRAGQPHLRRQACAVLPSCPSQRAAPPVTWR